MTLSLPPLPGTNTPHPAFYVTEYGNEPHFVHFELRLAIRKDGIFDPLAAAAIAHYWYLQMERLSVDENEWQTSCDQAGAWEKISMGSSDFVTAEIVGYKP